MSDGVVIYEAVILCLREACEAGIPGRTPREVAQIQATLDGYLLSMASENAVTGVTASLECRKTLLELSFKLRLANDPSLRIALRKDGERLAALLVSIFTSKSLEDVALRLEGDSAQCFLDVVQSTLDKGFFVAPDQSQMARRTIRKLSTSCDILPSSLFITGVTGKEEHPTFGGAYGDIYRASYENQNVALKYIRGVQFMRGPDLRRIRLKFCREALVWKALHHPHILPFLGIDGDGFPSSLCMVSPWMEHGTVMNYLKEHGLGNVDRLLYEIAQGLQYLHSCNIVHGDLRGTNILIKEDWSACLADFGLSVFLDATSSMSTNRGGSLYWMAPELLDPERIGDKCTRSTASDVYAFGCVCFELYTGRPPFAHLPEPGAMMQVIMNKRPVRPSSSTISDILWEYITAYWKDIPSDRPGTEIVVQNMKSLSPTLLRSTESSSPVLASSISPPGEFSAENSVQKIHFQSDDLNLPLQTIASNVYTGADSPFAGDQYETLYDCMCILSKVDKARPHRKVLADGPEDRPITSNEAVPSPSLRKSHFSDPTDSHSATYHNSEHTQIVSPLGENQGARDGFQYCNKKFALSATVKKMFGRRRPKDEPLHLSVQQTSFDRRYSSADDKQWEEYIHSDEQKHSVPSSGDRAGEDGSTKNIDWFSHSFPTAAGPRKDVRSRSLRRVTPRNKPNERMPFAAEDDMFMQDRASTSTASTVPPISANPEVNSASPRLKRALLPIPAVILESPSFWLVMYFCFNLGLTLYNKSVLISFPFPYTLSALHALFGTIGGTLLAHRGRFPSSCLDLHGIMTLMAFSILYAINIVVSNVSLQLVTVPFHQVVRAATPIFTILFSSLLFGTRSSHSKKISLLPVVAGVGLATFGDYYFSYTGFFLTLLGTIISALKTIFTNVLQTPTELPSSRSRLYFRNPFDLLFFLSPLALVHCVLLAHFTGELNCVRDFTLHEMSSLKLIALLLNGCIAFGLNVVNFCASRRVEALSMSVAANVKQVLTIVFAVMIFKITITTLNAVGIVLTLVGGAWYAWIELWLDTSGGQILILILIGV
ncbi:Kinase-like protein [Mycena sanguinolenta]|uniref:Kinase-like protein n=1 Tax=Mycena sanguinolenta TaxID=230812 RepID=A0A8H6YXT9_9AGAR|nr:Kinase-like protein [Mycena sanguinolenta]